MTTQILKESFTEFDKKVLAALGKAGQFLPPTFLSYMDERAGIAQPSIAFSQISGTSYRDYTPAWTSIGTQPAIGNGTIAGRYLQLGKLVIGRMTVTMGSTTTFGTGRYALTLPVSAASSNLSFFARYHDNGTGEFFGVAAGSSTTKLELFANNGASLTSDVAATTPFTWATSDIIDISFVYEAA